MNIPAWVVPIIIASPNELLLCLYTSVKEKLPNSVQPSVQVKIILVKPALALKFVGFGGTAKSSGP